MFAIALIIIIILLVLYNTGESFSNPRWAAMADPENGYDYFLSRWRYQQKREAETYSMAQSEIMRDYYRGILTCRDSVASAD